MNLLGLEINIKYVDTDCNAYSDKINSSQIHVLDKENDIKDQSRISQIKASYKCQT